MKDRYIAVTLVGGHKLYSMPLFFEYLLKLDPLPKELLISTTKEIFDKCMETYTGNILVTWIHGERDLGNDMIVSTTSAREALRNAILERGYEWSLWLDNDILVPPDLIEKFQILLSRHPDLLMVNAFHPARQDDCKVRHGLGSSFISKEILEAYPFTMATIRGKNLGDDYIWKMVIQHFGRRGLPILSGYYFDVKHFTKDGRIKEFLPEYKVKLL